MALLGAIKTFTVLVWLKFRDHLAGCPIDIILSLNPGFRRGEGGWVDGLGAFLVARGWGETAHAAVSR